MRISTYHALSDVKLVRMRCRENNRTRALSAPAIKCTRVLGAVLCNRSNRTLYRDMPMAAVPVACDGNAARAANHQSATIADQAWLLKYKNRQVVKSRFFGTSRTNASAQSPAHTTRLSLFGGKR